MTDTTTPAQRAAKFRLVNMRVPTVGVVDAGANQRPFFEIRKDASMPDPIAKALALPAAAKETMQKALSACVEKLLAASAMLDSATVDEAAPVPSELPELIRAEGQNLMALAEQFAPTPAVAPVEAAAPPEVKPEQMELAKSLAEAIEKAAPKMPLASYQKLNSRAMEAIMALLMEFAPHFGGGEPMAAPASVEPGAIEDAKKPAEEMKTIAKSLVQEELAPLQKAFADRLSGIEAMLGIVARSTPASNADTTEIRKEQARPMSVGPVNISREVRKELGRE